MDDTLRAADRDRDQVADILREQYALGRLTLEEYDERSATAIAAKTMGELRALTVDLPAPAPAESKSGTAAWSTTRMRLIAVAGVIAAVAIVAGAGIAGHVFLAFPGWLVVLLVVRHLHGGNRLRHQHGRRRGRPGRA